MQIVNNSLRSFLLIEEKEKCLHARVIIFHWNKLNPKMNE